jgi:hypothetical protein
MSAAKLRRDERRRVATEIRTAKNTVLSQLEYRGLCKVIVTAKDCSCCNFVLERGVSNASHPGVHPASHVVQLLAPPISCPCDLRFTTPLLQHVSALTGASDKSVCAACRHSSPCNCRGWARYPALRLDGVGVVRTGPWARTAVGRVRILDIHHGAVRAADHEEEASDLQSCRIWISRSPYGVVKISGRTHDYEHTPSHHEIPLGRAGVAPVVV